MSNPIVTRLWKGFAAHGLSQILVIVVQLVSIPLFTEKWGAVRYGEWLTLSALPGYLTIADLSFGATAGNHMTMLAGAGKEDEAQRVYRSSWVLILALSVLVLVVASALTLALPFDRWLHLETFTRQEAVLSMLLLIGQVVLSQQGSALGAAFRAGGFYATGIFSNDILRFLEFAAVVATVLAGGGPVAISVVALVIRSLNYLVQYVYVRRLVPWLSLGFRGATLDVIRPLVAPALAYNALPLAQATALQGTVVVVNQIVGPTTVVAFTATRTVARLVYQWVTLVANIAWPEFSRALGAGEDDVARRLHRRACQVGFWLAIVGAALVAAIGPTLYLHWTRGNAPFYPVVFGIMLVNVVLTCFWSVSYVVPLSVNRHEKATMRYLVATLLGLILCIALGLAFGLPGIAFGLIPVDLIMIAVVVPMSMRLLEDDEGYANLVRPPFRWFFGKLRTMIRSRARNEP